VTTPGECQSALKFEYFRVSAALTCIIFEVCAPGRDLDWYTVPLLVCMSRRLSI
jgi:hypothetical protein